MDALSEEQSLVRCPGDEVWASVRQAFFEVRGADAFAEIKACASDPDFMAWLRKQTVKEPSGGALRALPEDGLKFHGKIPLALCPVDFSRKAALRSVTSQALQQKMEAFAVAGTFRDHDVLQISRTDESSGSEVCSSRISTSVSALCQLYSVFVGSYSSRFQKR